MIFYDIFAEAPASTPTHGSFTILERIESIRVRFKQIEAVGISPDALAFFTTDSMLYTRFNPEGVFINH
jgi:hypothetical protein